MADQRPLSHQQVEQLLAVYRDLSSQEKTAVAEHLAACQDCASLAQENRQIDAVLKQATWKRPDPRLSDNFYQAVERDGRSWFQTFSRLGGQFAGIAVLALVVFSAWLVLRSGSNQTPVEEPTVTAAPVTAVDSGMPLSFRYSLTETVSLFALGPEGSYLATTAENNIVKIWEASSGNQLHSLKEEPFSIESLAFTPNGVNLLARDTDGQFHRWLAYNGAYQRTFNGAQSEPGTPFALSNTTLALITAENELELWSLTGNRPRKTIKTTGTPITSLTISPDGQMIAAVLQHGTIFVWNQYGDVVGTFTPSQETVIGLAISNNGKVIAANQGNSFQLRQENAFRYQLPPNPSPASGDIITIRFLSEDQFLMVGYEEGFLQSWNTSSGELVKTFQSDPAVQAAIGLTRNGFLYATLDSQGLLSIWERTE
jgi:WD40 repeat protein